MPTVSPAGRGRRRPAAEHGRRDRALSQECHRPGKQERRILRQRDEADPRTLPDSSWKGVAALRTTSITLDDFSSTTLIAIQFPYRTISMKISTERPNPSR